ncbi:MAG: hypothetical protein N2483_08445, partial [Burkholderiaceae bacterium]|nr:hypothetical protein [Burkholderiaceae bacterium]
MKAARSGETATSRRAFLQGALARQDLAHRLRRAVRGEVLFDAASRTLDDAGRGALYRQAQAILAQDLPYWWLVETDFT